MLVAPVLLTVISVISMILVVSFKVNQNMISEMAAQSDYLLTSVAARLTDYDQNDLENYQYVMEDFETAPNVEYSGFVDADYQLKAMSGEDM